jgi:CDP-glycerol glycerophosphotransferase (TagB/SpsB family)
METTTIKLYKDTKSQLDLYREYKNESYDEVIKKMIYIIKTIKTEPWRGKETLKAIELSRERMKRGNFVSDEEASKRLGL